MPVCVDSRNIKNTILLLLYQKLIVEPDGRAVTIIWTEDHERRCTSTWLFFNCQCDQCTSPNTTKPNKVNPKWDKDVYGDNIKLEKVELSGDDFRCLIRCYPDTAHETTLPLKYLRATCNCADCLKTEISRRQVTLPVHDDTAPYIDIKDMESDEGFFGFEKTIVERGFCVVRNVPVDDKNESAFNIVKKIGGTRYTVYGHEWTLSNKVKPIDVGFTATGLVSHQDMIVYETKPGLMFLFALRFDNDVQGGESTIVDALKCAEILRQKHSEHFKTLCRVPGSNSNIHLERAVPVWMCHTKPHIEVDYFGEIVAINWSPISEGTVLKCKQNDVETYYKAHKVFRDIMEENQVTFRLRTGDMAVVNNHRSLHSRKPFTSRQDGDRTLCGFYTNLDDFKSHYIAMAAKLGEIISPPRLLNRSSF